MAGIQVLRFESRKKLSPALLDHVKGVTRPPTSRPLPDVLGVHEPVELGAIVHLGGVGVEAAREAIDRHRPTGRGRRPNEVLDVLFAGPPPYGGPDQWDNARELQWARDSAAWLRDIVGPESVVLTAELHRDETAPHLHVMLVPIAGGRLAWKRVRDAAVERIQERSPPASGRKSRGRHRDAYRLIQDDYHARVGSRFNLARGEVGSEATHTSIDRARAVEARVSIALDEAQHAEDRANAALVIERAAETRAARLDREADARIEAANKREREAAVSVQVARVERESEETAARVAREQREDDEALGTRALAGRAVRRGRELRDHYETRIAVAESERDQAAAAEARVRTELAAERERHQVTRDERDRARKLAVSRGRRVSASLYEGLRAAGHLISDTLRAVRFPVDAVPLLAGVVQALRSVDAREPKTLKDLAAVQESVDRTNELQGSAPEAEADARKREAGTAPARPGTARAPGLLVAPGEGDREL